MARLRIRVRRRRVQPRRLRQRGTQFARGLGRRRRSRWLVRVMLAWALSGIGFILVHLIVTIFG
ncbi:MAG: hypothetical protein NVSMB48_27490 [Marmoricola sp.]